MAAREWKATSASCLLICSRLLASCWRISSCWSKSRISTHQQNEEKRLERIREEERIKAESAAQAKVDDEICLRVAPEVKSQLEAQQVAAIEERRKAAKISASAKIGEKNFADHHPLLVPPAISSRTSCRMFRWMMK